jgi:hypothetical protein
MNELLVTGLWRRLRQLATSAKKKHAAIAYVTDDTKIAFGEGDVLIADASDEAIQSGQTSAVVLKAAWKRGARIFSIRRLHAKVYVFDKYAVIGSANLSKESEKRTEAALLTDQPTVVSAARLLIDRLRQTGDVVDKEFIERICKLPVEKRARPVHGQRIKLKGDRRPRTWLVGLMPVREKAEEKDVVERGMKEAEKHVSHEDSSVSFIRFRGNSRFRREAQAGDVLVCIWTPSGKGEPEAVYHHSPILLRKDDVENNLTWFYVEEFPDAHNTTLTWKQFQKLFVRIGAPGRLSQWASRELPQHFSDAMHDLWFDQ